MRGSSPRNLKGALRQGHAMKFPSLHPLGRDGPHSRRQVELAPTREPRLARPRRREDDERQRARRHAGHAPQLGQESRRFDVRKCRMVLHPPHLLGLAQGVFQMAEQARRVGCVLGAVALHPRPLQRCRNALPQALASVGLVQPDRFKDSMHQASVDRRHRQRADDREGVAFERAQPLRTPFGRSPLRRAGGDGLPGRILEGNGVERGDAAPCRAGRSRLDRINSLAKEAPGFEGLFPGLGERHKLGGTQPLGPLATLALVD